MLDTHNSNHRSAIKNVTRTIFTISLAFGASLVFRPRPLSSPKSLIVFRLKVLSNYIWIASYYMTLTYSIVLHFREADLKKRLLERILFTVSHTTRLLSNLTILVTCLCFFHKRQYNAILCEYRRIDAQIARIQRTDFVQNCNPNNGNKSRFTILLLVAFVSLNFVILLMDYVDSDDGRLLAYLVGTTVYVVPNVSMTLMQVQFVNYMRMLKERYDRVNQLLRQALLDKRRRSAIIRWNVNVESVDFAKQAS